MLAFCSSAGGFPLKFLFLLLFLFLCFSYCSFRSVVILYMNLFYILLFNFAFLLLSFLYFTMFECLFRFICSVSQLALWSGFVSRFAFWLALSLTGWFHFWLPLLTRSLSCTFFSHLSFFFWSVLVLCVWERVPLFLLLFVWICYYHLSGVCFLFLVVLFVY